MKNLHANAKTIDDYFAAPDVHELQRESASSIGTLSVALLMFAVEVILLYAMFNDQIVLMYGFILHITIVALLVSYVGFAWTWGNENHFSALLLIAGATMGPLGAAGTILSMLVYQWNARHRQSFHDLFLSLFPSLAKNRPQRIYDDIRTGRDESGTSYSVIPFLDVLTFGDELQKRDALAKMSANYHPNFTVAFKMALNDPSNTIRIQAAAAIARIEAQFQKRMMKMTVLKDKHERDPVVIRALAELYDDYSYTDLIDPNRKITNRQKALSHYMEYLRLKPDDKEIIVRIGRIFMRNHDYIQACNWFQQYMVLGEPSEFAHWYAEALFLCGQYERLRSYLAEQSSVNDKEVDFQPGLKGALALWSEGKA